MRVYSLIQLQIIHRFVGGGLQAPSIEALQQSGVKVTTIAMGTVHLQLGVVLRNFDKFGIDV
jgi:B9 domain-containing protein 2